MILPPSDLTLRARNGHFRITSLVAEEFPWHELAPAVVGGNSGSAQFLAAMPATRPSASVQRAAFRAGEVHGMGQGVGQSGTHPQDDNQQGNLEKRVAHETQLNVNSSTASDGRGRKSEQERGNSPWGLIKRDDMSSCASVVLGVSGHGFSHAVHAQLIAAALAADEALKESV